MVLAQSGDCRYVSGGAELLTEAVCEELRTSEELKASVRGMRDRESGIRSRTAGMDSARIRKACQCSICRYVPGADLDKLCAADGDGIDSTSFARAVNNLPRKPSTAAHRKLAREVARVLALVDGQGIIVPGSVEDFRRLWEQANYGEPRWSADFPSSEFRTQASAVITSVFEREVMQVSTHHENIEAELEQLSGFLSDSFLEPEIRAACGFIAFEFTHPFADGNGHTGRMLLLSMLQERYSVATMTCFAEELALGRSKASHQFALVRSGEHGLVDYCRAMLAYLYEAQGQVEDLFL